jgi:TIR domain
MNTGQKPKTLEVLCCYAREDRSFVDKLTKHLSSLVRQETITIWSDYDIHAGSEWESEIEAHLDMADIILLFVSADFISSDYCYSKEMQCAMGRHERGEAWVVPLIIRFCDWKTTPLGKLQALPEDAKPVDRRHQNRGRASQICASILVRDRSNEVRRGQFVGPVLNVNKTHAGRASLDTN